MERTHFYKNVDSISSRCLVCGCCRVVVGFIKRAGIVDVAFFEVTQSECFRSNSIIAEEQLHVSVMKCRFEKI